VNLGQFLADHWGDLASVVGLVIVIWASLTAKNAAEQARDAARQVKDRIATLDTLADVSTALAIMEEIKRLQRAGAWPIALDRYSTLRRHLIRVEQMNPTLKETQRTQVAGAIVQFRIIERKIEKAMSVPDSRIDTARFNAILSSQIDALEGVLSLIKRAGV